MNASATFAPVVQNCRMHQLFLLLLLKIVDCFTYFCSLSLKVSNTFTTFAPFVLNYRMPYLLFPFCLKLTNSFTSFVPFV